MDPAPRLVPSYMRATSSSVKRNMPCIHLHPPSASKKGPPPPSLPPTTSSNRRRWTARPTIFASQDNTVEWRSIPIQKCPDEGLTPQVSTPSIDGDNQSEPERSRLESAPSRPPRPSDMTSVQVLRLEALGNAQMALIKTLQDDVGNLTKQFALFTAQPCAKSSTPAPATSFPHSHHQRVATNEGDTQSKCNQTHEDENRRLAASLDEANTKLSAQDKTMRQLQADNDELQALLRAAGRDLTREEDRVVKLKQHIESLQQTTLMPVCNNQHEPSSPTSSPQMGKRTAPLRFG